MHNSQAMGKYFGQMTHSKLMIQFAEDVKSKHSETGQVLISLSLLYMLHCVESDASSVIDAMDKKMYRKLEDKLRQLCI